MWGAVAVDGRASAQANGLASPLGFLSIEETESLVRQVYYEGMPEEAAARIGPDGALRLIEMLGDPEEKANHARILLALGLWGGEGAFEAVSGWAPKPSSTGELDRDAFRAWQVRPFALGKLARRDPRAVARLAACFEADAPAWAFRHFQGTRLQSLERRAAVTALAESALPEAAQALEDVARRSSDPELVGHVRDAQAEARRARAGAAGR